ncbi:hypothetical protein TrLO_g8871 [Triparma laevis f. longispina]|uniref:Uncharacterized protein n=1 Tax=Triparma laevis f. longispina TaxID=1714387 RepID=A0A9W7CE65_9STRA|nr:hypothetical protein TrLO_g8871 [Triparma laevis f. longispina]
MSSTTSQSPLHEKSHDMSPPPPPPPPTPEPTAQPTTTTPQLQIQEGSMLYSCILFVITSTHLFLSARFAIRKTRAAEIKVLLFFPLAVACMCLSFALRPRDTSKRHTALLIVQYSLFSYGSFVCWSLGRRQSGSDLVFFTVTRVVIATCLLMFAFECRRKIASRPDKELANFLATGVLRDGILAGLGQILFLGVESSRCYADLDPDETKDECNRSLKSQTGLGMLVAIFVIIKVSSGAVPPQILSRHLVSPRQILTMDLNMGEAVQFFSFLNAFICVLFLLGFYGAEGDFTSPVEKTLINTVTIVGGALLTFTSIWKGYQIWQDMKVGVDNLPPAKEYPLVKELHIFWTAMALFSTSFVTIMNINASIIYTAGSTNANFTFVRNFLLPLAMIPFVAAFLGRPGEEGRKYKCFLILHFLLFGWVNEFLLAYHSKLSQPNHVSSETILHIVVFLCWPFVLYLALMIRSSIADLEPVELDEFLTVRMFRSNFAVVSPIFFVNFRSIKCVLEEGSPSQCSSTSYCALFLSFYLDFWLVLTLVTGSIKKSFRSRLQVSVEKVSKMKVTTRQSLVGTALAITFACGAFLYTLMSSEVSDQQETIKRVGVLGAGCILFAVTSEVIKAVQAQKMRKRSLATDTSRNSGLVKSSRDLENVQECSIFYSILGLLVIAGQAIFLVVGYAINGSSLVLLLSLTLNPVCFFALIIALHSRPLKSPCLANIQFSIFCIVTPIFFALGDIKYGSLTAAIMQVVRIVLVYIPFYMFAFKIRAFQNSFPPPSNFYTSTLLRNLLSLLLPILFLSFESLSCSFRYSPKQCVNSTAASSWLNIFLVSLYYINIVSTIKKTRQLTYSKILSLDLTVNQKLRIVTLLPCILISLYLLGLVEARGSSSYITAILGGVGLILLGVHALLVYRDAGDDEGRETRDDSDIDPTSNIALGALI